MVNSMRRRPEPMGRRFMLAVAAIVPLTLLPSGAADASGGGPGTSTAARDAQSTDNLDAATLNTMRQQEALQPALQAIGDEQVKDPTSGYAGIAFEGAGLTLYWKGALTPGMTAALQSGRRSGSVVVKPAPFSAAELHAEGSKIHGEISRRGATDIQSIGYEVDGTGLYITKQPFATMATFAAARIRHGKAPIVPAEQLVTEAEVTVPVRFEAATSDITPSSRTSDSSPWNGGGRWTNTTKGVNCTTGFGVHSYGHSYVLTAAHCASAGDVVKEHGVLMGPVHYDGWSYDLLLIDAPGWHVTFDGSPTTSNTKNVNSWGYWAANELVCQSGATSGTVCGIKQVRSLDITWSHPDSDGDWGYAVYGVIESVKTDGTAAGQGGDSGGPVFTLDGAGVRAKGILCSGSSPNYMYFQDWATVLSQTAAYPNTTSTTS